jgi:hypothetical protein
VGYNISRGVLTVFFYNAIYLKANTRNVPFHAEVGRRVLCLGESGARREDPISSRAFEVVRAKYMARDTYGT